MKHKQQPTLDDLHLAFPNVPDDIELLEYDGVYFAASPTINQQYRFSGRSDKWNKITKGTMEGYTCTGIRGKTLRMHIILAKHWNIFVQGKHIDHIDGVRDNNIRDNLRAATNIENQYNAYKHSSNTSGYKGVNWNKQSSSWKANIGSNKRKIHIGLFDSPEEAYIAYCKTADRLHGDFVKYDKELYNKCLLLTNTKY